MIVRREDDGSFSSHPIIIECENDMHARAISNVYFTHLGLICDLNLMRL